MYLMDDRRKSSLVHIVLYSGLPFIATYYDLNFLKLIQFTRLYESILLSMFCTLTILKLAFHQVSVLQIDYSKLQLV